MNQALQAYYNMIDDCGDNVEWIRKIEEELGQNIAMLTLAFDESVRDELVERSELYRRFVSRIYSLIIMLTGLREAKVLQVRMQRQI